jgi:hypothetical protein
MSFPNTLTLPNFFSSYIYIHSMTFSCIVMVRYEHINTVIFSSFAMEVRYETTRAVYSHDLHAGKKYVYIWTNNTMQIQYNRPAQILGAKSPQILKISWQCLQFSAYYYSNGFVTLHH